MTEQLQPEQHRESTGLISLGRSKNGSYCFLEQSAEGMSHIIIPNPKIIKIPLSPDPADGYPEHIKLLKEWLNED